MDGMTFCPRCAERLERRIVDDRDRLVCPEDGCGYVFWDNPVPVVAAVVEHEGRVLLARNREWPEKMFGLITGFLEKGEGPGEGIVREIREELGLDTRKIHLIGLYPFFRMNQLIIAYHALCRGEIRLGDELAEVKPVPPGKLRPWDIGTGPAVRDWLKTRNQD